MSLSPISASSDLRGVSYRGRGRPRLIALSSPFLTFRRFSE